MIAIAPFAPAPAGLVTANPAAGAATELRPDAAQASTHAADPARGEESRRAVRAAAEGDRAESAGGQPGARPGSTAGTTSDARSARPDLAAATSDEHAAEIAELRSRDRKVRAHEQAHARVGGVYASAPSYVIEVGPDGRRYAVGGEVSIDVSPVPGDPAATVQKMEQVADAALAPADPSAADRRVAAVANAQRVEAMTELARMRAAHIRGEDRAAHAKPEAPWRLVMRAYAALRSPPGADLHAVA